MANTAPVYVRVEAGLKENAEGILAQLGISPSEAIKMLYSQIVLVKGMPFPVTFAAYLPAHAAEASGIAFAAASHIHLRAGQ